MPSPMQSSTLQYYAYWKQYYVFLKENEPKVLTQLYIEKLFRNQVPVIWNLQHLSELLGVKISTLGHMISKPHAFYRHFEIPKRQGGSRQISAPQPVLLEAQRWIKLHILQELPLHPAAKGFRRQQSICSNAAPHLGRPYLLKMDLKNFFPSISMHRVISVFRHLGYSEKVAYALAALCCSRQALPQGAASSPDLSNHIARRWMPG
ncbi:reverse transcriptase domain-containing protein [Nitritalea halalkaliphila]|uniref:reverse transcriptase domain-containing protein n=1 Tax=Nitritalea halalkaliphila TaxID=590849 RepID=UPI0006832258|nr:reverse transcriptase domain-containing protein [Nitritalea halalkaliphila]